MLYLCDYVCFLGLTLYTLGHRLIIPRLTKLFVFLENWTFCYPVLGSRHCTCAYTETADPACRPSIPHKWYWQGTAGVSRFNLKWKRYRPLPFSPLEVHTLCFRYCYYASNGQTISMLFYLLPWQARFLCGHWDIFWTVRCTVLFPSLKEQCHIQRNTVESN